MYINIQEELLLKSVIKSNDLLFLILPFEKNNEINNCIKNVTLKNDDINKEIKIIELDEKKGTICHPLKTFIEMNLKQNPLIKFYIKRKKNSDSNNNDIIQNYQIMANDNLEDICQIYKNENIEYSYYQIENDKEIFNETKKALNESYNDIWTQFEKKTKLNQDLEVIGTRQFINGEFKEYNYMKISECFSLSEKIGNGLAFIGLKENDMVLEFMSQRIEVPIINMGIWRQVGIIAP